MTWLRDNYPTLIAAAGALWTLLSILNGMIKNPVAKTWIGKIMDGLSYVCRGQAVGSVKPPFTLSRSTPNPKPSDAAAVVAAMVVAFLFLPIAACAGAQAWGVCTLGKLPQAAQPAFPSIVQALENPSQDAALSALEQVALGLAPGQVDCIVQAIAADEAAKNSKAPAMLSARSMTVRKNAEAWLARKAAK